MQSGPDVGRWEKVLSHSVKRSWECELGKGPDGENGGWGWVRFGQIGRGLVALGSLDWW